MSSFGPKRKAKIIIQTFDGGDELTQTTPEESQSDQVPAIGRIKFRSKPNKSSALRKTITINDDTPDQSASPSAAGEHNDGEDSGVPVVVRPVTSRAGSAKQKKRPAASKKISFNETEAADDEDDDSKPTVIQPPKKTLGQRALEKNALRRSAASAALPMRFGGGDEDRPKYSKEYLEELQSSTPATPATVVALPDEDEMQLDESELDGALVVQQTSVAAFSSHPEPAAHVLSAAEIRERKDRRARLAQEVKSGDFISLDSNSDSERRVLPSKKKKSSESRLIAEDEDLGEGYDEFVQDSTLALGKKAEKDAARRHRAEIAELINAAESDVESDESEAERMAAYEAAQRRAGMDGLHKPEEDEANIGIDAIPRMKPLPKLNEVLQRMRDIVQGLEDEVMRKRRTIEGLEKERREIEEREKEVQEILNQAGAKYQEVVGGAAGRGNVAKLVQESISAAQAGQSPLRPLPSGFRVDVPMERGLESFGTPTRQEDTEMTG
ncbi:nineteen complex-related protein 2-domain-containing protein [Podospora fimiseda]|uniref:Nineteen complex-related protein 2-domain-containing protein n=1 Tax=Podospora fimiseda TaxID=252190 RepID=A0AAN7BYB8_9PEZI|nr:nineteen complex-related protein 2-domain-containing protein [Podospora fimiseda]